ncbi:MAG TPA: hypothetical protein VFR37_16590 [Longimicrobium sp.]|nr:hypothetical protein [Longimicrobium sp.]
MGTLIQAAAELAQPWADLYGGSTGVASAVAFLHFGGLMAAGGTALAADRGVLRHGVRPWPERLAFARELRATHAVVLAGLAAVVASGLLLLAADVETLLPSPVFWAKMAAFALLLLNGLLLRRAGEAVAAAPDAAPGPADPPLDEPPPAHPGERPWRALRGASLRSAALWFAVLFLGTLLTAAA